MHFSYREAYHKEPPEAYETLLLDILLGDATLFMRADQVETAWSIIDPIEEGWRSNPTPGFPNYAAGTWGPGEAEQMVAKDGFTWFMPDSLLEALNKKPETVLSQPSQGEQLGSKV
jgi:glucose-6-phosphate 1-dehydrogenase